jgi:hypothetical protein
MGIMPMMFLSVSELTIPVELHHSHYLGLPWSGDDVFFLVICTATLVASYLLERL